MRGPGRRTRRRLCGCWRCPCWWKGGTGLRSRLCSRCRSGPWTTGQLVDEVADRWPGRAAVACAGPPGGRASGSVRGRAGRHPAGRPRPRPFHPEASGRLWTRALTGELIFKLYRVRFADQVGIRSDQVTGRTWGARGSTPIVRRNGNRFSVNAMSAISTKGRMHFTVLTESFDAKVMGRFLDRLVGHFDREVHLIVDRHSAHRSKTVRPWLADHEAQIELHFLPSYSPEPNPDELVDADLKRSPPHTHRARNQAELATETRRFFHRRQNRPHISRGHFSGRHARYILDE
ncbi:IS630 family transposase [Streptomyces wedmorensis]|uniref:IS630 family transposase n=1 Tax=Streptomyces wedmorensis TaxID=43759 RepID=UPI0037B9A727